MKVHKWNKDNKTDKAKRNQENLRCDRCPPNRGENKKNYKKWGVKKPKNKTDKRKGFKEHGCPPKCAGCAAE